MAGLSIIEVFKPQNENKMAEYIVLEVFCINFGMISRK